MNMIETKTVTNDYVSESFATDKDFLPLTRIAEGDTDETRTGKKISPMTFYASLVVTWRATALGSIAPCRLIIFLDKNSNGNLPPKTGDDALLNDHTIFGIYNKKTIGVRYIILKDKFMNPSVHGSSNASERGFNMKVKLGKRQSYYLLGTSTNTALGRNQYYMCLLSQYDTASLD